MALPLRCWVHTHKPTVTSPAAASSLTSPQSGEKSVPRSAERQAAIRAMDDAACDAYLRQIEDALCCPISFQPMRHPVQLPCTHVYDRSSIERWRKTQKEQQHAATCPSCRAPIPNRFLKASVYTPHKALCQISWQYHWFFKWRHDKKKFLQSLDSDFPFPSPDRPLSPDGLEEYLQTKNQSLQRRHETFSKIRYLFRVGAF